jgi:hypothetical protein
LPGITLRGIGRCGIPRGEMVMRGVVTRRAVLFRQIASAGLTIPFSAEQYINEADESVERKTLRVFEGS